VRKKSRSVAPHKQRLLDLRARLVGEYQRLGDFVRAANDDSMTAKNGRDLRRQVCRDLRAYELRQFDRLVDPVSPESSFGNPRIEMTCLEMVSIGCKS